MEPDRRDVCPRCGLFLQACGAPDLCASCFRTPPPFIRHRSAGVYDGLLKRLILLFKYGDGEALGRELALFTWEALREDELLWRGAESIVPVPLHRRRRRKRGFNQAAVLARRLSDRAGVPVLEGLLERIKDVPPQAGMKSAERRRNVVGAFRVRRPKEAAGGSFLLVDDVYTTGSTMGECCRALLRAGARDVRALTLARVQP